MWRQDMAACSGFLENYLEELIDWEISINRAYKGIGYIRVMNNVDDSGPPSDFTMIFDYVSSCVDLAVEPIIGCECNDCSDSASSNCCPALADARRKKPNYVNGKVNVRPGLPLFECNMRCRCGFECPNRVVQKGVTINFEIFKTKDNRGWGLKTLETICKGQFVIEYLGEVITDSEAQRREESNASVGCTYMFDLDFDSSVANSYVVDATHYGNPSRFINHSCSPNLEVYAVYINLVDGRLPRLALFASKHIKKGEELTFDYKMNSQRSRRKQNGQLFPRIRCLCGSKNCKKFVN